jgi:hypothetical protein
MEPERPMQEDRGKHAPEERPSIRIPQSLHPLAREVLEALRSKPEARAIVLGGGVALQHYCDFRQTVDLDAWWAHGADARARVAIKDAMKDLSRRHGLTFGVRTWRETESYELRKGRRKVFSFQISERTIQLEGPLESPWGAVRIEAFRDNLGSKMSALVDRGAPRDFVDVYELVHRGLTTCESCWALWREKNRGKDEDAGRIAVLHHLEAIEARRPLKSIEDAAETERARALRKWIREVFCRGAEQSGSGT